MNCKNCKSVLNDTNSYCSVCGAKVIKNRLTTRNLFNHISEEYFDYDNKFFKTFIHLFTKPEEVIGGYINGTRKKYINVINYFAIAISVAGLQLFLLNKFFPEFMDPSNFSDIIGLANNDEFEKSQLEIQSSIMNFIQEYQSIIMMFYIPLYALISKLVFLNIKKYNYTEHLVIFMYVQAQSTIFLAPITIILAIISNKLLIVLSLLTIPIMIVYTAFCLKRLYNLSLERIILKTLIFILILGVLFVLFIIVYTIIVFLSGGFDSIIESTQQTPGG